MKSGKTVEKIKTGLIFLLIVSLFLHLGIYLNIKKPHIFDGSAPRNEGGTPDLGTYILPQFIYAARGDGSGDYAMLSLTAEIHSPVRSIVERIFSLSGNKTFKFAKPASQALLTMVYKSRLTFSDLRELSGTESEEIAETEEFKEIRLDSDGNVFFKFGSKYYSFAGAGLESAETAAAKNIASIVSDRSTLRYGYYNDVLIPVSGYLAPPDYVPGPEKEIPASKIEEFASAIFGSGGSFIKSMMTDTGSIIMVYGYGDEVLKVENMGFRYSKNRIVPARNTGLKAAEEAASAFLTRVYKDRYPLSLSRLEKGTDDADYVFYYSKSRFDFPIHCVNSSDIRLAVKHGTVSSYSEDLVNYAVDTGKSNYSGVDFSGKSVRDRLVSEGKGLERAYISYCSDGLGYVPKLVFEDEEGDHEKDYYAFLRIRR